MTAEPKNIFRIHVGLVLAEVICIPAFVFELYRALAGNGLSWAYVGEWPLLGIYAIYMWKKMLREERGDVKPGRVAKVEGEDARLAEWNAYLASIHKNDQPATPESRDV
jgi:hypothetical protein